MKRDIESIHKAQTAHDGAGVKLQRFFPVPEFDHLDPFLLFDHFGSNHSEDFIEGFPEHPHRGIETVTYMLEGRVKHRDSTGHSGIIEAGDVQWMSAGRGIMHEEMPEIADGKLSGFQLWLNLPAKDKMKKAEYQEYKASEITAFQHEGHHIRLICGELLGKTGVVTNVSSSPLYADIYLNKGTLNLDLSTENNAFIYVLEGELEVINESSKAKNITSPQMATLTKGNQLTLKTQSNARFLIASARSINEPIERSGPFVMNTKQEILDTWRELRAGTFPPS